MFLCTDCHDNNKCGWGLIELPSYGKCEDCGKVTGCTDCHNY